MTASDQDYGIDGDLIFSFVNSQSKFLLTQANNEAELRLAQVMDYDQGDKAFSLQVKVSGMYSLHML